MTHAIRFISICALLVLCFSCANSDGPEIYESSVRQQAHGNLNMKGEPLRSTTTNETARIQSQLEYLGYNPGSVNGTCCPRTTQAIKRFQSEHGIQNDGVAGPLTEESLRRAIHARRNLQNGYQQK